MAQPADLALDGWRSHTREPNARTIRSPAGSWADIAEVYPIAVHRAITGEGGLPGRGDGARSVALPGVRGRWISRIRFQPVLAYRELAVNAAATLTTGMAVTVTGKLLDDSFTPEGSDYPVRRDKLEALDIAVSLRFATAVVTRTGKSSREQALEHNREQLAEAGA